MGNGSQPVTPAPGTPRLILIYTTFGQRDCNTPGFDFLNTDPSNLARREAAELAISTGEPAATAPIRFSESLTFQALFVAVFDEFEGGSSSGDAPLGMISLVFNGASMVRTALGLEVSDILLTVTDTASGIVVREPDPERAIRRAENAASTTRYAVVFGRNWTLEYVASDEFDARAQDDSVVVGAVVAGLMLLVLLAALYVLNQESVVQRGLTRMLLNTSHDMRTPLYSVSGGLDMLRDARAPGIDDSEREELEIDAINTIQWGTVAARNIVDNLLDVNHIGRSQLTFRDRPCDVEEVITTAVGIVRGAISLSSTSLSLTFAGRHYKRSALCDVDKLQRTVMNIVGNACKFTASRGRQGHVRVEVAFGPDALDARDEVAAGGTTPTVSPAEFPDVIVGPDLAATTQFGDTSLAFRDDVLHVRVTVRDNGAGMDSRMLREATQPHVHAARDQLGGSGIGLYVSKCCVEHYDGVLRLSSDGPGRGSTVEFTMKLRPAEPLDVPDLADKSAEAGSFVRFRRTRVTPVSPPIGAIAEEKSRDQSRSPPVAQAAAAADGAPAAHGGTSGSHLVASPTASLDSKTDDIAWLEENPRGILLVIVDDAKANRRINKAATRGMYSPMRVVMQEDGTDTLKFLTKLVNSGVSQARIFVLTDINMAVMNGDEATRLYRTVCKDAGVGDLDQAWICAFTGDAHTSEAAFKRIGCDAVLLKPADRNSVQALLGAAIRRRIAPASDVAASGREAT